MPIPLLEMDRVRDLGVQVQYKLEIKSRISSTLNNISVICYNTLHPRNVHV